MGTKQGCATKLKEEEYPSGHPVTASLPESCSSELFKFSTTHESTLRQSFLQPWFSQAANQLRQSVPRAIIKLVPPGKV
jgi:hypothetical protein